MAERQTAKKVSDHLYSSIGSVKPGNPHRHRVLDGPSGNIESSSVPPSKRRRKVSPSKRKADASKEGNDGQPGFNIIAQPSVSEHITKLTSPVPRAADSVSPGSRFQPVTVLPQHLSQHAYIAGLLERNKAYTGERIPSPHRVIKVEQISPDKKRYTISTNENSRSPNPHSKQPSPKPQHKHPSTHNSPAPKSQLEKESERSVSPSKPRFIEHSDLRVSPVPIVSLVRTTLTNSMSPSGRVNLVAIQGQKLAVDRMPISHDMVVPPSESFRSVSPHRGASVVHFQGGMPRTAIGDISPFPAVAAGGPTPWLIPGVRGITPHPFPITSPRIRPSPTLSPWHESTPVHRLFASSHLEKRGQSHDQTADLLRTPSPSNKKGSSPGRVVKLPSPAHKYPDKVEQRLSPTVPYIGMGTSPAQHVPERRKSPALSPHERRPSPHIVFTEKKSSPAPVYSPEHLKLSTTPLEVLPANLPFQSNAYHAISHVHHQKEDLETDRGKASPAHIVEVMAHKVDALGSHHQKRPGQAEPVNLVKTISHGREEHVKENKRSEAVMSAGLTQKLIAQHLQRGPFIAASGHIPPVSSDPIPKIFSPAILQVKGESQHRRIQLPFIRKSVSELPRGKPSESDSEGMPTLFPEDVSPDNKAGNLIKRTNVKTIEEEPEAVMISMRSPFNMRVQNLANFPQGTSNSTYRATYRAQSMAMHRAKAQCTTSAAKSLDILRQNLQKSINKDIEKVIQKYSEKFFKPGIDNIRLNNGANSVSNEHMHAVCRQILEEAKKIYMTETVRSVTPLRDISDNVSDAGSHSSRKGGLKKRLSDTDSEASIVVKKRKKGRPPLLSGRCTPSKMLRPNEPVRREGPKWDPERIKHDTLFVMGARANKALGLGATRGRIYIKHPEVFKYSGDQEDKQWLYDSHRMPATGGKAYMLIVADILDIAKTDEYRNSSGVRVDDLSGFTAPEWMIDKIKQQMTILRSDATKGKHVNSYSTNSVPFYSQDIPDTGTNALPFTSFASPNILSAEAKALDMQLQDSPANTDDLLSIVDNDEQGIGEMSPFNVTGGFDEGSSPTPSDLDTLEDESVITTFGL